MKVAAFELASGKTVIAEVDDEDEDMFIVRNPMEMLMSMDSAGSITFRLIRWLPFNDMNQALVNKSMVQGMSTLNDEMTNMYKSKVDMLNMSKDIMKEFAANNDQRNSTLLH